MQAVTAVVIRSFIITSLRAALFMLSQSQSVWCGFNIGRGRWAGHVACMEDEKYKILVGTPVRKKPLGRPRRRWEDNIRMDLRETVGRCGLDSSGSG
jgi:hypothetical protein